MSDVRTLLAEADWTERERRHVARAEPIVAPRRERARTGRTHPVWDFLFTYYSYKPTQLLRWHPGYGMRLAGAAATLGADGLAGLREDEEAFQLGRPLRSSRNSWPTRPSLPPS